jgi:acylphosphatase
MNSRTAIKALIGGRVQGVGFRYFTCTLAFQYGLKGYVRNLPDGKVEVLAVGEREVLEAFVAELRCGPPTGKVDHCQVRWLAAPEPYTAFSIRP